MGEEGKHWQKTLTSLYYIETLYGDLQKFPLLSWQNLPSQQIWETFLLSLIYLHFPQMYL